MGTMQSNRRAALPQAGSQGQCSQKPDQARHHWAIIQKTRSGCLARNPARFGKRQRWAKAVYAVILSTPFNAPSAPDASSRTASYSAKHSDLEWAACDLFKAIGNGTLDANINFEYPLRDAVKAHQAIESGTTLGATVLIPRARSEHSIKCLFATTADEERLRVTPSRRTRGEC